MGGSRFLFDSFDAAAARIEANERVAEERWAALEYRLGQIEPCWSGWRKRLWLGGLRGCGLPAGAGGRGS
jgi:hypothetical protein